MAKLPRRHCANLEGMPGSQPTDLSWSTGSSALVYLIHGVTGTPVEMRSLAYGMALRGWDVYATTLPGHCRRLRDLVQTREGDWRQHVYRQLAFIRTRYQSVFVAGLSAGALLSLDAAAEMPVDGVGVLSPTFIYDGWNEPWSNLILPLAMKWIPYSLQHLLFHIDGPPFGLKDPVLQARVRAAYHPWAAFVDWLDMVWPRRFWSAGNAGRESPVSASHGYPLFPLQILTEIDRLITRVRLSMNRVMAPTLILQAVEDDMTSPRNAQIVYEALGSQVKQVVLLEDCYHVITVDKQKRTVTRHLGDFMDAHLHPELPPQAS